MANEKIDVAVVGGGVSGVYAAWRLKVADPKRKVVLFEGSDHIGGRLLSVRPPRIGNMVAELGGMRILPAVQPLIGRLIEVLNNELAPDHAIETYEFPVDKPQNIAYLRGSHLRLSDFRLAPDKVPYHLSFLESGGTAGSIIIGAIEQIVPGITNASLTEAQRRSLAQEAHFDGRPLYAQGFWNVLSRIISGEAYLLGVDAGGYHSTLSNWNAADAIPWYLSDFGVTPKYRGFKNGFQQVPLTLARLFENAGGEVRLNSRLDGFHRSDGRMRISVLGETIEAESLILAMPRRSLELVMPGSPPLAAIIDDLVSVTPRPLFKLFTTYANPWWRSAGFTGADGSFVAVESGRSVTDLPVRQIYYWPTDDGAPAKDGPAMLMASYDDGTNVGFWDGLRPRRGQAWEARLEVPKPANAFAVSNDSTIADPRWLRYQAPAPMVAEVARQLGQVHGLSYTPTVLDAAFRDWGDDPFGGGWNSWNIGVRSPEVKARVIHPSDGLFICGEAYSDAQGWVEGALQTADMVLAKFGLAAL